MSAAALRPAAREEAQALAALHAQAFAAPWPQSAFADLLGAPGVFALVAAEDDALHGLIVMRAIPGEAEVLTLAVAPHHRRRGLGQTLLAAGLDLARQAGAGMAFLEVAVDNPAALALYRAAGFAAVGRRRGYYHHDEGAPIDALVLSRALNSREP